jgi:hypothetical protein
MARQAAIIYVFDCKNGDMHQDKEKKSAKQSSRKQLPFPPSIVAVLS